MTRSEDRQDEMLSRPEEVLARDLRVDPAPLIVDEDSVRAILKSLRFPSEPPPSDPNRR